MSPELVAGRGSGRGSGWVAALSAVALLVLPAAPVGAGVTETPPVAVAATPGLAVEGSDHARMLLPASTPVESYADAGYTLTVETSADGGLEATVEVDLVPLGSEAPFNPPPLAEGSEPGPVEALARRLTAGTNRRYDAVSAILGWMVHHLAGDAGEARFAAPERPDGSAAVPPAPTGGAAGETTGARTAAPTAVDTGIDASVDADPEAVLERGSGSAEGIARLAVALLAAVGIDARTVRGQVVGPPEIGSPHGPHTWIEVRFPRLGWVPSDPLYFHHYVPATYLRLAAPRPAPVAGLAAAKDGTRGVGEPPNPQPSPDPQGADPAAAGLRLVERRDRRQTVDLYPPGGPGVTARKNDAAQRAGVLRVVVSGAGRGSAVLEGAGGRRSKILVAGESVFVGLQGGLYRLEVYLEGRPPIVRQLQVGPRERRAVFLREDGGPGSGQGAEQPPGRAAPGAAHGQSRSPRHRELPNQPVAPVLRPSSRP